jgi:hypothetical protein
MNGPTNAPTTLFTSIFWTKRNHKTLSHLIGQSVLVNSKEFQVESYDRNKNNKKSKGTNIQIHSSPSNNKQHGYFCFGRATAMATCIDFQTTPAHIQLPQSVICHSELNV